MPLLPVIRDTAAADPDLVRKLVAQGWIGQPWRGYARCAVSVNHDGQVHAVNGEGRDCLGMIDQATRDMLRAMFTPAQGRNVYFAARGRKLHDPLWIVDCLRHEGCDLSVATFEDRWKRIPKAFISPTLKLATPLLTESRIVYELARGQVLMRAPKSRGFAASSTLMLRVRSGA